MALKPVKMMTKVAKKLIKSVRAYLKHQITSAVFFSSPKFSSLSVLYEYLTN